MNHKLSAEGVATLEKAINYTFKDHKQLLTALTHRSAARKNSLEHYENFEYLGDAVLDLAIAHILIEAHPDYNEGQLSKMRAALVNADSLANTARRLEIGKLLILSNSEHKSGGAEKSSILADALESIFGAIYLESGFETAFAVIKNLFTGQIGNVSIKDPKTELQETLHKLSRPAPEYHLDTCEGPVHAPIFNTSVSVGGKILGRGRGSSKKIAQQAAAQEALTSLNKEISHE